MIWLFQTLKETKCLSKLPSPDIPCITFCGTHDEVVDIPTIKDRMMHWSAGKLELIESAKHDVFSEIPAIREKVITDICELFAKSNRSST